MNVFSIKIPDYEYNSIFKPVRDKVDYVEVLMIVINYFLLTNHLNPHDYIQGKIIIDKMSRFFIYDNDKYFSFSFPFVVYLEGESYVVKTYSGKVINHKSISEILYIINSSQFNLSRSLIDFYIDPNDIDFSTIYLLEEILMFEPAYMRYDYDPDPNRLDAEFHPLNHLDIHYSQYATLKIGLDDRINSESFENIHNLKTRCYYITIIP